MEIGQTLNQRYTLTARLGKGAMGIVYRASDAQTGQDVAVKVITGELELDDALLERFRREGEALRQLRHPNIVGFVDTFEYENQHVIVMEYVPGGSLHGLLKHGPLPIERTRRMALELCDALTRAHHLNIIHRDLKPENVLLAADGTPKLTDFGVARLVSEGTRITGTGTQVGTPFYMSPEAWEGKPLDAQADIWSLGILLYEMLSGQVPFAGDTVVAVMNKVLNAPIPDLKTLRPDVPPGLANIVQRMLERDKSERYQSMRELGADLERGQPLTTLAAQPTRVRALPTVVRPPKSQVAQPPRQRPLWPWLVGGVAVLAVVGLGVLGLGAGWLFFGRGATPSPATLIPSVAPSPISTATLIQPATAAPPTQAAPTARPSAVASPVVVVPATDLPANPPLPVGVLLPMSGANAAFGSSALAAVQMAVDEWNAQGGVLGRTIVPKLADGQCEANPAVAAAKQLIGAGQVHYLIGEICSRASIPVSAIAESEHVVEISPASTAAELTLVNNSSTKAYVFRACFIDPFQGTAMANFAFGQKFTRAYVIYDQTNSYSSGLAKYFMAAFQKAGGQTVANAAYTPQTTDFATILDKVAASQAQVLFVPDFGSRVNLIAQQARQKGLQAVLMGGDGWEGSDLDLAAVNGGYYSTAFFLQSPEAGAQDWVARYRTRYGLDPDGMAALSYDAANLLFTAIQQAGVDDPSKVKDVLAGLHFEGVTGPIDFDAQHNPIKNVIVMQVKDGQRVYITTIKP